MGSSSTASLKRLENKVLIPFIAPPNGGKGTQTRILSTKYRFPTFDMGATFRAILKEGHDPQLAEELQAFMSQGKLVPIETVMKVFEKGFLELAQAHPEATGFILDGFPRSLDQANALLSFTQQHQASIPCVVYLKVGLQTVEKRSTGRRFCSKDPNHVYNIYEPKFQPKKQNINQSPTADANGTTQWYCDYDGAELIVRADDEPGTVKKRLSEYASETDPIIGFFQNKDLLAEVNGEQQPEQVTQDIETLLEPALKQSQASSKNKAVI